MGCENHFGGDRLAFGGRDFLACQDILQFKLRVELEKLATHKLKLVLLFKQALHGWDSCRGEDYGICVCIKPTSPDLAQTGEQAIHQVLGKA